jgi:ribosomal protein S18 acetylase RimI-like enzyme
MSLDVGTDNEKGVNFYKKMGMKIQKLYMSPNQDEFALFETPLDK